MTARLVPVSVRLAWRELRGGIAGFRLFLVCLALGVAAIAAVGTASRGVLDGLAAEGRALVGGDIAVSTVFEPPTAAQRAWLDARGTRSSAATLRAMATPAGGGGGPVALVDLKAVDRLYPLGGTVTLDHPEAPAVPVPDLASALALRAGVWGAVVDPVLLDRLGVGVGDQVRIGSADVEIRAVVTAEPDRLGGGGFTLGPRVMIAEGALGASGLVQPGSLIRWHDRLALAPGVAPASVRAALTEAFPDAGWRITDRDRASPEISRLVDRLTLFLTLVGLTALVIGGVGAGTAVAAFLDSRLATIATLRCLGASGRRVVVIYLIQVMVLALAGVAAGVLLGAAIAWAAVPALAGLLPVAPERAVDLAALGRAGGFGLLAALAFSLWPLARARRVAPAALFRDRVAPAPGGLPGPVSLAAIGLAGVAIVALAVVGAERPQVVLWFFGGTAAALVLVRVAAWGAERLAARLPVPASPVWRLAFANLHRPGNPTASVVLALGLGLTVLVAITTIEANFTGRLDDRLPTDAPDLFLIDIQPDQLAPLGAAVAEIGGPGLEVVSVPALRGRILKVNDRPAADAVVDPEAAWVLRGDRGITYGSDLPAGSTVVAGDWWDPAGPPGPPRVSIYRAIADAFAIGPGDRLTVSILGRPVTATVANVRDIDFLRIGLNFTLVYAPGLLEAAPHTHVATIRAPADTLDRIERAVTAEFPNVSVVRVREVADGVVELLTKIGTAVRVAALVTLVVGTLVVAGAIAAGQRRRRYEAAVLTVLGASRGRLVAALVIELALLGLVAAVVATGLGTLAAWAVVTQALGWPWLAAPAAAATAVALALAATVGAGTAAVRHALRAAPAPLLRSL